MKGLFLLHIFLGGNIMKNTKTKVNRQEKVKEAFELVKKGAVDIAKSSNFQRFLKFSASFHNYSFRNQLLIWIQKPSATFVAGFETWKKRGRYVKKGEKGIMILAPMKITRKNDEHEEDEEFMLFRPIYVFDISQTEGEPIPSIGEYVKTLNGETDLYEKIKAISPFPVTETTDCKGADGYYRIKEKDIFIDSKNSTSHKLLTLIHEMGHGLLHADRNNIPSKAVREIEAECVGFVTCHALGIDTSENSFGYIASYGRSRSDELIDKSRERINRAVHRILGDFEDTYVAIEDKELV